MYLTTGEAAKQCGVKLNTIKNWIRSGELTAIQTPGGHWRIPRASFLAFMDRFTTPKPIDGAEATRKCILLIDDDIGAHELMSGALKIDDVDYDIHSAYDGVSGLVEIGLLQPDLIVLDIMMPGINGLEIIHRLKAADSALSDAKILVITAASDRRLVVNRIREAGPAAILFKPLNINTFIKSVHLLLGDAGQAHGLQGAGV